METNIQQSETALKDQELKPHQPLIISPEGKAYLISTAKWSSFIAIVGIVLIVFTLISGIFTLFLSAVVGEYQDFDLIQYFPATIYIVGITNIIFSVICFFPFYYLFLFSSKIKKGMANDNQEYLNEGLKNVKKASKFTGILTIISLTLLLLFIPVLIFSIGMIQALAGGITF
ncbi:MAG: hypothetical protein GX102_02460 [Porphyromonadaceae bacterium]|nr:hypothetical protein [Porphyromonadaceae bacterium]